jgi:hypothetical protein
MSTDGDKLLEQFNNGYNDLIKEIENNNIGILNNYVINKIVNLVNIVKKLDPPESNDTLKNKIYGIYKKFTDDNNISYIKNIKNIIDDEGDDFKTEMDDLLDNHNDYDTFILSAKPLFDKYYVKNTKGPYITHNVSYVNYEVINNKFNITYSTSDFMVFIAIILEKIANNGTSMKGGSSYDKKYSLGTPPPLYYRDNNGNTKSVDLVRASNIMSFLRKQEMTCEEIIKIFNKNLIDLSSDEETRFKSIPLESKYTSADPCVGLSSHKRSTSTNCDKLEELGIKEYNPRNPKSNTPINWNEIKRYSNQFNLKGNFTNCGEELSDLKMVVITPSTMRGGADIDDLKNLSKIDAALPVPSFTGQITDIAIKLVEGLKRSNINLSQAELDSLINQIKTTQDLEEDLHKKLSKYAEVYNLSLKTSENSQKDDLTVDNADAYKEELIKHIQKLQKRGECLKNLIFAATAY